MGDQVNRSFKDVVYPYSAPLLEFVFDQKNQVKGKFYGMDFNSVGYGIKLESDPILKGFVDGIANEIYMNMLSQNPDEKLSSEIQNCDLGNYLRFSEEAGSREIGFRKYLEFRVNYIWGSSSRSLNYFEKSTIENMIVGRLLVRQIPMRQKMDSLLERNPQIAEALARMNALLKELSGLSFHRGK